MTDLFLAKKLGPYLLLQRFHSQHWHIFGEHGGLLLLHFVKWAGLFCRTLCDTNNAGMLSREQFALAMYLIAEKVNS